MKQKQIFEITDNAALQITKAADLANSKGWPLRIAVNVDKDKFNYLMGFDESKEEDLRLKIKNIDIIISPDSMINLKNCKLDYVELEEKKYEFIFLNPNDPSYKPPDDSLDNNVTHDL
jgi:iron-sulfur cluster assembly protein|tara:strand:+ start:1900 stop:2253 length:354 start_codon:yes stop_codon:yes gene_type:complete